MTKREMRQKPIQNEYMNRPIGKIRRDSTAQELRTMNVNPIEELKKDSNMTYDKGVACHKSVSNRIEMAMEVNTLGCLYWNEEVVRQYHSAKRF